MGRGHGVPILLGGQGINYIYLKANQYVEIHSDLTPISLEQTGKPPDTIRIALCKPYHRTI